MDVNEKLKVKSIKVLASLPVSTNVAIVRRLFLYLTGVVHCMSNKFLRIRNSLILLV
jgi:hypothetical protein